MNAGAELQPELLRLAALGWNVDDFTLTPEGVRIAGDALAVNYLDSAHEALGLDGGAGYWFDHRADAVIDALTTTTSARALWDVGAGTGAMTLRLARAGFEVVAVEPLREGANAIAAQERGAVFCGSLEALHLPSESIPIVGLFDVIEHLDDPATFMAEVRRVLEPSGVVAITVPAFQSLWSNADIAAGHQRRYTTKSLDGFLLECGFQRLDSCYIFASLLLPTALLRALPYRLGHRPSTEKVMATASKALEPGPTVDTAIRTVLRGETAVSKRVRLPAGLSALGVYRPN